MMQQQTFEIKDTREELATISDVLHLLHLGLIERAKEVLITRHDLLMTEPKVKAYDPREART